MIVTHKPNILDAFGKDWFDVRKERHRYSSRMGAEDTKSSRACRQMSGANWHTQARTDALRLLGRSEALMVLFFLVFLSGLLSNNVVRQGRLVAVKRHRYARCLPPR
jgi:hypothetical protein